MFVSFHSLIDCTTSLWILYYCWGIPLVSSTQFPSKGLGRPMHANSDRTATTSSSLLSLSTNLLMFHHPNCRLRLEKSRFSTKFNLFGLSDLPGIFYRILKLIYLIRIYFETLTFSQILARSFLEWWYESIINNIHKIYKCWRCWVWKPRGNVERARRLRIPMTFPGMQRDTKLLNSCSATCTRNK